MQCTAAAALLGLIRANSANTHRHTRTHTHIQGIAYVHETFGALLRHVARGSETGDAIIKSVRRTTKLTFREQTGLGRSQIFADDKCCNCFGIAVGSWQLVRRGSAQVATAVATASVTYSY